MWISVALVIATQVALPAWFIVASWQAREHTVADYLVCTLYRGLFLVYLFIVGRWDWLSYYLRYVMLAAFAISVVRGLYRIRSAPPGVSDGVSLRVTRVTNLALVIVFGALLAMTLRGRFYPGPPVALAFPIKDGWHYVAHGGASTLLNYHHRNRAQRYALDIDALGRLGRRADGLYPRNLQRYVAFGQTVSSPCDGRVTAAQDGHPDQAPHTSDREHPMGNHVVIACQDALVLLAHLRSGSVAARADANVRRGQRLGEIGNSGNTSEPHLHIHAVRAGSGTVEDGEGVPVVFDGRFLTRNATRQ